MKKTYSMPCHVHLSLIQKTQEEHGVPPNKHHEMPFEKGYTVLFPFHLSTIWWKVVILYTFREIRHRLPRRYICICYKKSVAFWWLAEDLEEHGVFLKKHYEIPFLKEYTTIFLFHLSTTRWNIVTPTSTTKKTYSMLCHVHLSLIKKT